MDSIPPPLPRDQPAQKSPCKIGLKCLYQDGNVDENRSQKIDVITKNNDFTSSSFVKRTWREKLSFVVFREREQQSMNHFHLQAASKLKFLIFYAQTRKGKTGSLNFSNRLRRRSHPSK